MEFSPCERKAIKQHFLESPRLSLEGFYSTGGAWGAFPVPCVSAASEGSLPLSPLAPEIRNPSGKDRRVPKGGSSASSLLPQVTLPCTFSSAKLLKPLSNPVCLPFVIIHQASPPGFSKESS